MKRSVLKKKNIVKSIEGRIKKTIRNTVLELHLLCMKNLSKYPLSSSSLQNHAILLSLSYLFASGAYYRDRTFNQYRSTAARMHIYRDRQSSMGNKESSEKLIQQRGKKREEGGGEGRTEWSIRGGRRGEEATELE